jgi:hypothetical protein
VDRSKCLVFSANVNIFNAAFRERGTDNASQAGQAGRGAGLPRAAQVPRGSAAGSDALSGAAYSTQVASKIRNPISFGVGLKYIFGCASILFYLFVSHHLHRELSSIPLLQLTQCRVN